MMLINQEEFNRLVEWVSEHTGEDVFAEKMARAMVNAHDFSDPERTHTLELSGTDTLSGNPETFAINPDAVDWAATA